MNIPLTAPFASIGATPLADATPSRLQGLIWPEPGLCTERDLYMRLHGPAGLSQTGREVQFAAGGMAGFDTYFNLFNLGKWLRHCGLVDLHLVLWGAGLFEVTVFLALPDRSWERLVTEVVTLTEDAPAQFDLSQAMAFGPQGIVFFELRALGPGRLTDAAWQTRQPPRRTPRLAVSITTFRREAAVRQSVDRFEDFIESSPLRNQIRLIVVDNGQSAGLVPGPYVSPVSNDNLGGSGGFARGLIEAEAAGATHCLFMDDDAAIHMQSLERTWQMLAHATDPHTAIAGAMTVAAHRWALWENGAIFDSRCQPRFNGTDLRHAGQVFAMEFATTGPAPRNLYGGWWFFAFPIDRLRHRPFPFFVRGDDVSFSLANGFDIVTLPGVVCFQDADFAEKETAQTLYLDLRSHLAHHLSLPQMDIGRLRTLRIALWFFARALVQCHYDTLATLNLALEDVLEGPGFFARNADMAQRRADIRALADAEIWTEAPPRRPKDRLWFNPHRRFDRALMKLTLNGHLLPFFALYGNRVTLEPRARGHLRPVWGAARITYLDPAQARACRLNHSKRLAWRQGWRMARNAGRFLWRYPRLKADWQRGYAELTTDTFWRKALRI
ncbi:glycosyltransferase family 2 protein [Phaeovulum veldkampii]|uniref:Glycosyl transferase n=1 Tax=Phaeovulum veldkampii DSM 11550 TaxID=1185920 RepID=A0A2T4JL94_9RHOB|nr:glycosyltransferase [Phaeovulum veldkampii]PTE18675.1 hypothetical protein C5F46_03495 [Phaeovulum veldkampii DSM 11550]TDQ57309.1 GT2 family glycosyltransferase [Phaeovulum veldkampii DSM 11550]